MDINQMIQMEPRLGELFNEAKGKGCGGGMWYWYHYERFLERLRHWVGSSARLNALSDKESYNTARDHLEKMLRTQPEQAEILQRDAHKLQNIAELVKPAETLSYANRVFDSEQALKEVRRLAGIYRIYKGQKAAAKADLEALLVQAEELDAKFGRELDPVRWKALSDQRADLQREIEYTRIVAKLDPKKELSKIPSDLEQYFQQAAREYHTFYREYRARLEALKLQYDTAVAEADELVQMHPYWQTFLLNLSSRKIITMKGGKH